MELTQAQIKRALDMPALMTDPGTELPHFEAFQLARVLELEIAKASARELTHIRLNMGLADAGALAAFLRRGSEKGI